MKKQIEYIIKNFDFKKVCTAMNSVGWKLGNKKVTVDDLKQQARDLLENLETNSSYSYDGLTAINDDNVLYLEFCLESLSAKRICNNCGNKYANYEFSLYGIQYCFECYDGLKNN